MVIIIDHILIAFEEGNGCNLSVDDAEAGYVDYINYSYFKIDNEVVGDLANGYPLEPCDGGMILLKENYTTMDEETLIRKVLDFVFDGLGNALYEKVHIVRKDKEV